MTTPSAPAASAHGDGPLRVLLAGGGTTGHVAPLLATADCLRSRDAGAAVLALGTAEGLESRLVPERGYRLHVVPRVPLPRRPSAELLRLPNRLRAAVAAADAAIRDIDAQVVVGFGGYVSTPAYLAARRRGVPVVVHEQNAKPGLANRLGARWAAAVGVTFADTPLPRATRVGMPLRPEITSLADPATRDEVRAQAQRELGLAPGRVTLLVTGGSLGAARLNAAVVAAAGRLAEAGVQVLHLTGAGKEVTPDLPVGSPAWVVRPYLDAMQLAYAVADVVVCRAGASTVSELTLLGLPAVYVPLAIGNGEQRLNAEPVVRAGGGRLVPDAELDDERLLTEVLPLLTQAAARATAGAVAASFGILDGAQRLADLVETAARAGTASRRQGTDGSDRR